MRAPTPCRGVARGTITGLPAAGQVIRQGQVLYRVDEAPVVLLYGAMPAYRALAEGATGEDVRRSSTTTWWRCGYLRRSEVDSTCRRTSSAGPPGWAWRGCRSTSACDQTGVLALGACGLPAHCRARDRRCAPLSADPRAEPVLQASSTARTVSVALDAGLQSQVKPGDRVTITLPDGSTTPGRVTSVGKVATVPSAPAARTAVRRCRCSSDLPTARRPATSTRRRSRWPSPTRPCTMCWRCRWPRCWRAPAAATPSRWSPGTARTTWCRSAWGCSTTQQGWCRCPEPGLAAGQRVVVPGE